MEVPDTGLWWNSTLIHQYFAQRYPQHLIKILHRHNEVYAILLLLLEQYHLKKHSQWTNLKVFLG
jgi:hypothetical protein